MSATIRIFRVGDRLFSQVMNANHDSVDLRDERNETLLRTGADARMTNRDDRMNTLVVEYVEAQPCRVYYRIPLQTRFVVGTDVQRAEVDVSKRYIGNSGTVVMRPDLAASPYSYG